MPIHKHRSGFESFVTYETSYRIEIQFVNDKFEVVKILAPPPLNVFWTFHERYKTL